MGFVEGTWGADFCEDMNPQFGDIKIDGKNGLDAFPGSTLERELLAHGIQTVAICGFLTNCCCESTMRTACEKGFNVITLSDCMGATSIEAHESAVKNTHPFWCH